MSVTPSHEGGPIGHSTPVNSAVRHKQREAFPSLNFQSFSSSASDSRNASQPPDTSVSVSDHARSSHSRNQCVHAPPSFRSQPRLVQYKMSPRSMDLLSSGIISVLKEITEPDGNYNLAYQSVLNLSEEIRRCFTQLPGLGIFIVGSTLTGLAMKRNDIDLCLMYTEGEVPRSMAKNVLSGIQKALASGHWGRHNELIAAIVPVLILQHPNAGIGVHMNVNNSVGILNSSLIRCYVNFDFRVKPLIMYIKCWAKFQGINSAKDRTICSYALTLMVINYLQCGVTPAVLPCLHSTHASYFRGHIYDLSSVPVVIPPFPVESRNADSLATLLLGFFRHYCQKFHFSTQVVSVQEGNVISLETAKFKQRSKFFCITSQAPPNTYENAHLYVEEPFNLTNVARSVFDHGVFVKVMDVFKKSLNMLEETLNPYSILTHTFY